MTLLCFYGTSNFFLSVMCQNLKKSFHYEGLPKEWYRPWIQHLRRGLNLYIPLITFFRHFSMPGYVWPALAVERRGHRRSERERDRRQKFGRDFSFSRRFFAYTFIKRGALRRPCASLKSVLSVHPSFSGATTTTQLRGDKRNAWLGGRASDRVDFDILDLLL